MINPKHTDISRSGDLVAAMKDQLESWEFEDPRETWWKWQHQYAQAADRIEFLSERADALALQADEWEGKYQIVSELNAELRAENERLHEELAAAYIKLSGTDRHASDCATSNAPAMKPGPCDCDFAKHAQHTSNEARAALGEK